MLRGILIFLLALIIAFGSTIGLYKDEVKDMAGMIQDQINGVEKPDGPSEPGDDDELEAVSIALDTTAVKTVYDFGEEFTTEGLIITVTFSDGSVKEVSPDDCRITKADTTKAGTRQVVVAYGGIVARYEVTVNAKEYAPISSTPLVDIIGKNDSVPYRVEAENIDMVTPGVEKAEGFDSFVATAPAGAAITSGEQYLTGFGVKWNYFGFTFTSTEKQEGVILVLRVANSTGNQIDAGAVKMYLNLAIDEDGNTTGALPLDGYIIPADGACGWMDIVIRNVTIPEGTSTLTFEVQNDKVFDIDYVDFYVGMRYINSVVEIVDTTTIIKDLEALDTEKAFTRQDVADAHGLKPGQLFVEATSKLPEGKTTNNGTSVGAIGKGSQMSTTLRLAEDATVLIKFKASAVGKGAYYVKDNWNFYIDGVKLSTVQEINIEGGDAGAGVWWDWIYTDIGAINLSAGDHFFLLEVHGTDCNVDTVEFEVISLGSFDESGKNLEDMKQPDAPAPGADLVINGDGEYKFEAEDLDISNLTPSDGQTAAGIETPSGSGPATSGGKSIGMAGGGYVTLNVKLESKATIQIYATLAFAHGGNAAEFMSAAIGEIQLPANGTLPAGEGNMPYWNWAEIPMGGPVELEAGDYAITFNFLKNPNFDCIKIKVISDDGPAEEQFKITVEAEDFNAVDVKTRQDFIDAGKLQAGEYGTEVGNGETCIMGFLEGSVFSFDVTLDKAMDLELFLVGATDAANYDVASKLSLSVNGNPLTLSSGSLTGSGATPYWDWQTVSLCTGTLDAGTYTFTLTVLEGHPNLEKVFFVEAAGEPTPPPAHSCESVCPECGKCLDSECTDPACADKCQGHAPVVVTPDVTVATEGETRVEFETLNLANSTIVLRGDLINAGFTAPGNSEGRIWGMADGTTIRIYVKVDAACNLKLSLGGFGTAMSSFTYKFGDTVLTAEGNYGAGSVAAGVIGTVEVAEAGVYLFEFTTGGGTDLDYLLLEVVENTPVVTPDITISDASDSYKAEAEQLDLSTLVPQAGFEKPAIENFAGGQGLGGIAGGFLTDAATTEKDVTIALKIAFAKYEGGSILSFVSGVSVNGEPLVLTDGQVAPGTPENQWWNVSNVQVATIDLVAGQTYTFQVGVNCGNLDGYVLEVVQPTVVPDITISDASDSYKAEAEQLDLSTLVPQAGFEKPAIENFAGGQGLGGIAGGFLTDAATTEKDVTIALKIAFAKYEGGSILSFVSGVSVNGEPLVLTDGQVAPGTPENQWWNVSNVQVATIDLVAGQTYTFQVSVNSGNLDGYVLEVVTAPAHECESICPACGKCTDSECGETACADKCQGHHVDANISASDVSVTIEAENWYYADDAIVTRSEFVPSIGEGNLKSESGNGATCIFAFTAGSKFVINVEAASDMVVDLLLRGATDAQGYDVATKLAVTLNGQAVSGGFGSLTGSGATPYWDWQTTGLGRLNLVKGVNEITITVLDGHPNIDMIRLVPVKADVTVAASGSTVLHMENFEEHKSVIDSKDDFVNAYAGQGFKEGDVFKNPGLGRIYGFNASTFVMHVEVTEACTLNISVNLWNCNALNTYKYYFNGQAISCTNETAPGAAGTYEIGSVTVSEAGIYTFVFTTGGVDFDEVIFTVE